MKLPVVHRANRSPLSLSRQIRDMDRQLHQRRRITLQHRADLRAGIRSKLTSPVSILLATGAGFILGSSWASRRHANKAALSVSGKKPRLMRKSLSLLMRANGVLAILNTLLAVTTRLDRSFTMLSETQSPVTKPDHDPEIS